MDCGLSNQINSKGVDHRKLRRMQLNMGRSFWLQRLSWLIRGLRFSL